MDNVKPTKRWDRVPSSRERNVKSVTALLKVGVASVLAGALLTDCAKQLVQVPGPVGPAPTVQPSADIGRLVVTTEEVKSGSDEDFTSYEPYTVFDSAGHLVKEVSNSSGADVLELGAGQYSIRAETLRRRIIGVEVQIVAGMTTEVHLDGNWKPEPSSPPATLVIGPEGTPIGYRSVETPAPERSASSVQTRPRGQ
jgi:hypothetical protein